MNTIKDIENKTGKIKIAFATDDGTNLSSEHFGSAKRYLVYVLNNTLEFEKEIENQTMEERFHGDPNKAKSIRELLKDVQIFVGFVMGPNITRMRRFILPIISRIKRIHDAKAEILMHKDEILKYLNKEIKPIIIIDKQNDKTIIRVVDK